MGLFTKEKCFICSKEAGLLGRIKLADKSYLCKDCVKETSAFIDITRFTKEAVLENIEYMKKQDILYKQEYETLSKEEKERHVCVDQGIVFADSIGMFEVLSGKSKKAKYHELFRYDMVEKYEKYDVPNPNQTDGGRKFIEQGIKIKLKSKVGFEGLAKTETELKNSHAFVSEFKIKLGNDSDSNLAYSGVVNHFDRIFKKEETYKTFGQSLKESIIGTETERRHKAEAIQDVKDIASLVGGKIKGDDEKVKQAKQNMFYSMVEDIRESFGACDIKYTKLADEAEKRAWEK